MRMKRGIYKDDLAQVDYVEDSQNQVCVKMVPRIDMQKFRGFRASENKSRSRANARPPQKLFNEDNIRLIYSHAFQTHINILGRSVENLQTMVTSLFLRELATHERVIFIRL